MLVLWSASSIARLGRRAKRSTPRLRASLRPSTSPRSSPADPGVLCQLPQRAAGRHAGEPRQPPQAASRAERPGGPQPPQPHRYLPPAHHLRHAPVRPRHRDGGPQQGLGQRCWGGQDQRARARRHGRHGQDGAGQPLRAGAWRPGLARGGGRVRVVVLQPGHGREAPGLGRRLLQDGAGLVRPHRRGAGLPARQGRAAGRADRGQSAACHPRRPGAAAVRPGPPLGRQR